MNNCGARVHFYRVLPSFQPGGGFLGRCSVSPRENEDGRKGDRDEAAGKEGKKRRERERERERERDGKEAEHIGNSSSVDHYLFLTPPATRTHAKLLYVGRVNSASTQRPCLVQCPNYLTGILPSSCLIRVDRTCCYFY